MNGLDASLTQEFNFYLTLITTKLTGLHNLVECLVMGYILVHHLFIMI